MMCFITISVIHGHDVINSSHQPDRIDADQWYDTHIMLR